METDNLASRTVRSRKPTTTSILGAGLASMAAAVIANQIVRVILFAVLDLPREFPPLQTGSIMIFTLIGTGLGVLVYMLVIKRSANPTRTYLVIATIALILSILPNLGLMANPSAAPFPGGSALAFRVLVIFHFVAALVFIPLLLRLSWLGIEKA